MIRHIIYWVDELVCGDHHITTGELCSILSISKGTVMAVTEEPGCYKLCGHSWHTLRPGWQLPRIFCSDMVQEVKPSCCILSWGTEPGGIILNLKPSSSWGSVTASPRRRNSRMCHQQKRAAVWGWERCYAWELFRGKTVNSWLLYWNTVKSECLPLSLLPYVVSVGSVAALWQ